jgi:dipeptidyl aminopeptidase/acylaminoacyl peptidase
MVRAILTDQFGDLDMERPLLDKWSPLTDADKIAASLFVYQGPNDPTVPRSEAEQMVHALRARNVDTRPIAVTLAWSSTHAWRASSAIS